MKLHATHFFRKTLSLSSTNNCNLQIHHKENPRRFQHFFQEKKDVVSFFKSFNSAFTFQRPSNSNKGKSKCILFLKAFVNNENVRGVSCHPDLMGNCTCSHISWNYEPSKWFNSPFKVACGT